MEFRDFHFAPGDLEVRGFAAATVQGSGLSLDLVPRSAGPPFVDFEGGLWAEEEILRPVKDSVIGVRLRARAGA